MCPTYNYECGVCEHEFTETQSIKDEPLKQCPKCGKNTVYRIIKGKVGFNFVGEGFYENDYKDKK